VQPNHGSRERSSRLATIDPPASTHGSTVNVDGSGTSRTSSTGGISGMSISSSRTFSADCASVTPMPSVSLRSRFARCTTLVRMIPA
jgi:hypothetical protein